MADPLPDRISCALLQTPNPKPENGTLDPDPECKSEMQNGKSTKRQKTSFLHSFENVKQWKTEKIATSCCLFSEIIVWGMFIGILATSMLDLELVTCSTTTQISLLWTAMTVGSAIATPLGGFLLDRIDSRLYLGIFQLGFGAVTACIPQANSFLQVMAIIALNGIFVGFLDTGRNITAVKLWGWDGAMWLQFYHFIFAVGAAIAPLFVKPFLASQNYQSNCSNLQDNNDTMIYSNGKHISVQESILGDINENKDTIIYSMNSHMNITQNSSQGIFIQNITTNTTYGYLPHQESRIHIIFAVVGSLIVLSGISCIVCSVVLKKNTKKNRGLKKKPDSKASSDKQHKWYVVIMVILLFLRLGCIVGLEVTYGNILMIFLVKGLHWSKSNGVMALFTQKVTFAIARGCGVGLACFVNPTKIMFIDIILLLLSLSLMWLTKLFPDTSWLIWLSTAIAGAGLATFYSASMSWAERYLQLSGRVGGFFLLGTSLGCLTFPALTGYLFEHYTPWAFVYVSFSMTLLLLVVICASVKLGEWYLHTHTVQQYHIKDQVINEQELTILK